MEAGRSLADLVDPVQDQAVEVDVQVQGITEALHERHCTALHSWHLLVFPRSPTQGGKDRAHEDAQHLRGERCIVSHAEAQRERQREDPLPDRDLRKHAIHEPGGGVGHAAAPAGRANAATFAAETDDAILAAGIAVQPDEAVRQDAALEKAAQLAFDEARHGAALVLPAIQKGFELLTHHLIQDAVLGLTSAIAARQNPAAVDALASLCHERWRVPMPCQVARLHANRTVHCTWV